MLLWVQMGLNQDVNAAVPCPVPVNDLPAKICDIGIVQRIVILCQSGLLDGAGM